MVSRFPPEKCGIAIYTNNLVTAMKDNKMDVITIGSMNSTADHKIKFHGISFASQIRQIIKDEQLDQIHFQYIAPYFAPKLLNQPFIKALNQDIPVTVTLHEVQYSNKGIKNKVLRHIENQICKKAKNIIVHSPLQQKFLKNKGYNNISTVLMGITPTNNKPKNNHHLLSFGILSKEKGHIHLLRAMKHLKNHKLTLAGNPVNQAYADELQSYIKKHNLNHVTCDFGWISEKKKIQYFKDASIMIMPYIWGPYTSAVIADAVSYNIPVIVSEVGAVHEIAQEYNIGKVIHPNSHIAIQKAVLNVENNYTKYQKNITAYRKVANWNAVALATHKLYKR